MTNTRKIIEALRWLPHNTIGHPLYGILEVFLLTDLGNWCHDVTLPRNAEKVETQR